jgi:hypothetical protein
VPALAKITAAAKSPAFATLAAARAYDQGLTEAEYCLARVVASEAGNGTAMEQACIADATLNHAGGRTGAELVRHVTGGNGFGEQGPSRPVSTRLGPAPRHIETALAVLRRRGLFGFLAPEMYGCSRGAIRYFSPSGQAARSSEEPEKNLPPLVLLEKWTFNKKVVNRAALELGPPGPGSGQLEWVGPIAGVDPWRQMFLRRSTFAQAALYADARKVIESRGGYKGIPPFVSPGDALLVLGLVASLYMLRGVA